MTHDYRVDKNNPIHPGTYVKENIIPSGMSVKDAAFRMKIGRPALSNFLNGKASLSSEMALRLEKTFGADRRALVALQEAFQQHQRRKQDKEVAVHAYVPSFLTIKARQIQTWADTNLEARQELPVLLRRLAHSTGHELRQVDFPGYDNAERKSWDGHIEAGAATPWIPEGLSGWELSCKNNPKAKAEGDYRARMASVPPEARADHTFVFVTARNWAGKTQWAGEKNAAGDWKAVKAYDASDLEQWLEESVSARIWMAERLAVPISGFETLDLFWSRWAAASDPQMACEIFEPAVAVHRSVLGEWLRKPSERPLVVAADSKDEAVAFLACLFRDKEIPPEAKDLVAVFQSADTLRTLVASSARFIPVVCTEESERELATAYRRLHCVVVRSRNVVGSQADITVDLLGGQAFEKALAAMGVAGEAADRLARESGRSPTILRRLLSKIDAIRTPAWASNIEVAKSLVPIAFVGSWSQRSKPDCDVLSFLAEKPYPMVQDDLARLLQFDDCPVWSAGLHGGVASRIDALYAVRHVITQKDIDNFFYAAEYVLSESDPALELPEDERWAAALHGKVRDYSDALRGGIRDTLVILAVHGNVLFQERLAIDLEARVSNLVHKLLAPLTLDKLVSQDRDLPDYAEAAPDAFLKLIEQDLSSAEPVVSGLLKPVDSGMFGTRCLRTGLLWALEALAWKPQNLPRVCAVLAQLSRTRIDDNWVNKPVASLLAIFRFWMPQTAAPLNQRVRALELLIRLYPDIAWDICVSQFDSDSHLGFHSYRPHWRSDASGAGEPVTKKEAFEFARKALELAIAWPKHNAQTLGDLVEAVSRVPEAEATAIWDLVNTWSDSAADDRAKAVLRERIRRFAFTRRGRKRNPGDTTKERARVALSKLEPHDPVIRHGWLFARQWVEESADELEDEDLDIASRAERIHRMRVEAVHGIWAERGFEGVTALLPDSEAPGVVGQCITAVLPTVEGLKAFLLQCISIHGALESKVNGCIQGLLYSLTPEMRADLLGTMTKEGDADESLRLFKHAPFRLTTWQLVDKQPQAARKRYWSEVVPQWQKFDDAELAELVDRLLEVDRPRAAFVVVHLDWDRIETSRLKRLLHAVATGRAEPAGEYHLDAYQISAALESLGARPGVGTEDMAQIEFLFIKALRDTEHGIPNLERVIARSPSMFVEAVALMYKRSDQGVDPPEWRIDEPERRRAVASAAYELLQRIARLPGTRDDGSIDSVALETWLTEVRQQLAQHGRAAVGDHRIGELLSRAPEGNGGVWPCTPVCESLERIASEDMADGFRLGTYNGRGAHWRGEGGAEERGLADKYRGRAQQLSFDYPFVGSVLDSIADSYDRDAVREDANAVVRRRLDS